MDENKRVKKSDTSMKKRGSQIITIVCLAVFMYSIYGLVGIFMDYYQNRQVLAGAQQVYYNFDVEEEVVKEGVIRPQFNELRKINPDIVGWVSIEDTPLNYPILQSTNNDYYLSRNYKGEDSIAGSIFMDYRNEISSYSSNTILYGHRMKDNTMFDSLKSFLDKDFFDTHKIIKFDTLYESYDAEVFAAYNTTTDFDYIQTDFANEEEFSVLLDEIQRNAKYHTSIELNAGDQILTLSTCDYLLDRKKGRLVVHAKLVKKK